MTYSDKIEVLNDIAQNYLVEKGKNNVWNREIILLRCNRTVARCLYGSGT